jgi:hypothetical protein
MQKCPNCNHKLYGEEKRKRWCKFCGYNNDPDYLRRKKCQDMEKNGNKE